MDAIDCNVCLMPTMPYHFVRIDSPVVQALLRAAKAYEIEIDIPPHETWLKVEHGVSDRIVAQLRGRKRKSPAPSCATGSDSEWPTWPPAS